VQGSEDLLLHVQVLRTDEHSSNVLHGYGKVLPHAEAAQKLAFVLLILLLYLGS
jgi:hypothetical protein